MEFANRIAAVAACAGMVVSIAAQAQAQGPVESRLEARKVTVAADGKETLAAAETARPGDVIEYTATYTNNGKAPVRNLQATLPIPANTELIPGSARPGNARASVDAASFGDMPLMRRVTRDGKQLEEAVPVREYRYLRWTAGALAAGQSLAFTARVRVVDDRAAAPPGSPGARK